jgi:hypothetical protein
MAGRTGLERASKSRMKSLKNSRFEPVESTGTSTILDPATPAPTAHGSLTEAELVGVIARLTRLLMTADDDQTPDLVAERRSMREELEAVRRSMLPDDVRQLDDGQDW